MLRVYMSVAAGFLVAGQMTASGQTQGDVLLNAAMADPTMGPIVDAANKVGTLGVQPTDAAIIIALSGLAWKFLDGQQKGGTIETFNLWLRRALKVDQPNPPPPPVK